jgi:type VI secretion system protein ImpH
MAAAGGPPPQHLKFLRAVAGSAKRFGLFAILRGVEARADRMPRIGRARQPVQSPVDLAQLPTLAFPAPTIEAIDFRAQRPEIVGHYLGLTGPMGPLPTHMTEFAYYERRYAKTRPFGRWLDLLANRMLQLFYRAWGDSQPVVQADRPDDDRFAGYLGALTGAAEGVSDRAAFPALARLHYAALFASRRSAAAIEDALGYLLGLPVRVEEYLPRWRDVEPEDQTRLGQQFAGLGTEANIGAKVRTVVDAFRVTIAARDLRTFESLLPSGARFPLAMEALDAFTPGHLEWLMEIEIEEQHARPAKLDGRTRLGWTGWLAPKKVHGKRRSDVHLMRNARPAHAMAGG